MKNSAQMWYQLYEPLSVPNAEAFARLGQTLLPQFLGDPAIPVRELHLRRSVPTPGNEHCRRGFRLCEIADRDSGVFAIYISATGDHDQLYMQLGHELGHLRNADVYDGYAEGLCTWFARVLFQHGKRDWTDQDAYFQTDKSFYGPTYQLIVELERVCGVNALQSMFSFAEPAPSGRKFIAIDRWIAGIPNADEAKQTILRYSERIRALLPDDIAFVVPNAAPSLSVTTDAR
jgi:hypothetical protein